MGKKLLRRPVAPKDSTSAILQVFLKSSAGLLQGKPPRSLRFLVLLLMETSQQVEESRCFFSVHHQIQMSRQEHLIFSCLPQSWPRNSLPSLPGLSKAAICLLRLNVIKFSVETLEAHIAFGALRTRSSNFLTV